MDLTVERDTVVEAVAASIPPAVAVVALYIVGRSFPSDDGLSPTGAQAVVGVIVLFILLATAVGLWQARS